MCPLMLCTFRFLRNQMPLPSVRKFEKLFAPWYEKNRRDLPWRNTRDPYRIWVSEIMLQQTQVERVKDFYARFLKRFPRVEALAGASWEDVLECWRGLGYYRRARNLHKAAGVVVADFGGKFPRGFEDLKKLPGVGSYTAAAIASFAFGEKVPALDTNISRVFGRIFGERWEVLKPAERFEFAQKYIGGLSGRDFNYGLMDVGASVCNARAPRCGECCFLKVCGFAKMGFVEKVGDDTSRRGSLNSGLPGPVYRLPRVVPGLAFSDWRGFGRRRGGKPSGYPNAIKVAAGVLIHNKKILIAKRPKGKPLAGLWEFPGGKLEVRENERGCLKREFMEELGVEVAVRPPFYKTVTEHDGVEIALSFHRCSLLLGEVRPLEGQDFLWVDARKLDDFEFPAANREVIEILKEKTGMFYVS